MRRTALAAAVTTVLLVLPGGAGAYVGPEDVLFPSDGRLAPVLPAEPRHGAAGDAAPIDMLDIQEILELFRATQRSDVLTDDAADAETAAIDKDWTGQDMRDSRMLDRLERLHAAGTDAPSDAVMETLHDGAPLAHTGPGLLALGTALLCGALWTLVRSGKAATATHAAGVVGEVGGL